jgi:hypothetical protein
VRPDPRRGALASASSNTSMIFIPPVAGQDKARESRNG